MRRILIATMILVLPSFVLFYGWSQVGQSNYRRETSYGDVSVATAGRRDDIMVDTRAIQRVADETAWPVLMRLFAMNRGGQFDFEGWQRRLRGALSDEFLLHQYARGVALRQTADALGFEVPADVPARLLRQQNPTATEREFRDMIARQQGMTLEQYLDQERGRMLEGRTRQLLGYQVHASLFELWQEYLLQNEMIEVDYVSFRTNDHLASVEPTEAQRKAFFDEHREQFRIPAKLKLAYAKTTSRDIAERLRADLGEDELAAYYESIKDTAYQTPASARVRQIVFRIEGDRTEQDALDLAAGVKLRLDLGESFEDLANALSDWSASSASDEDRLAAAGFGAGGLVAERVDATSSFFSPTYRTTALALEAGAVSEPFVGEYGLGANRVRGAFLVLVEDKVEASYTPYEEVRDRLAQRLANERAIAELDRLQAEWEDAFHDHTAVAGFASWAGLPVEGPADVVFDGDRIGILPGVGSLGRARGTLEMLRMEGGVGVVRVGNALVALEVLDSRAGFVPRRIEDDPDTSATLTNYLRRHLAAQKAAEAADALLARLEATPDAFHSVADEEGLQVASVGPMVRTAIQDPILSQVTDFDRLSLVLPEGSIRRDGVFPNEVGDPALYIVWRMTGKVEPSMEDFRSQYASIERGYLASKAEGMLDERYVDLLNAGAVKVTPNPRLRSNW